MMCWRMIRSCKAVGEGKGTRSVEVRLDFAELRIANTASGKYSQPELAYVALT